MLKPEGALAGPNQANREPTGVGSRQAELPALPR
jgi:hypothetical protein